MTMPPKIKLFNTIVAFGFTTGIVVSCKPTSSDEPIAYYDNKYETHNELVSEIQSSAFLEGWNEQIAVSCMQYTQEGNSQIHLFMQNSTCPSLYIVVFILIDNEWTILDMAIRYNSVSTETCSSIGSAYVSAMNVDCDISMIPSWLGDELTLQVNIDHCVINILDVCPYNINGNCIDGTSISNISISGTYISGFVRGEC